ncbi:MAG: hypothetical protein J0L92_10475 [Deltaproteobacteria bacterium]|nr:hypothetical protein [Deltaproteobacteria bacterium]
MHAKPLLLAVSMAVIASACGGAEPASAPPPTTATPPATAIAAATCMPPGLEAAHEVEIVRLPAGCSFGSGGSLTAPTVLIDDAAVAAALTCNGPTTPTIPLGADQLHVVTYTMSPAFGGMAIVDDGTTITYVMRDRPPCPGDPMPMPMPSSALAYRVPHGATRTYRELACTLPRTCS